MTLEALAPQTLAERLEALLDRYAKLELQVRNLGMSRSVEAA